MYVTNYEILMNILTFLTLIIQFYVIFLVQFKTPKAMFEYRFFLNIFSTWDTIFTLLVGVVFQPYPITPRMASAARGISSYFGATASMIVGAISITSGACVLLSQNYCILYRFTVIFNNRLFHRFLMHTITKITCLLLGHCVCFGIGYFFYCILVVPEVIPFRLIMKTLSSPTDLQPGEIIVMIDTHIPLTKKFILIILVLFLLSQLFSAWLVVTILVILRKNSGKFSKNTYRLHIQFTLLIAIQLITPLFLIVGPVSLYLLIVLFGRQSTPLISKIGYLLITFYGASNSIFTIIFVTPYRHYTNEHCVQPWWKPLLHFLRKYSLLPKQSIVSTVYNKWVNQQSNHLTASTHGPGILE